MIFQFTEDILEYDPADFEAWKKGDKEKILNGRWAPDHIYNQPSYHFGEHFALKYYTERGWNGYVFYTFREQPYEREIEGHAKIIELFPPDRLAAFRVAHAKINHGDERGEPDVFLFKDDGQTMFIEVKKDGDRMRDEQLETLAQINAILNADVGIAHVVKKGPNRLPRVFELDLETYKGKRSAK